MRRKMDVILDNIFNEHKDSISKRNGEFGNEDLVDVLLRVKESGELHLPINDANIKAIIYDIFSGGTETSSSTINWTMAELIKNPRVMAKAQAEEVTFSFFHSGSGRRVCPGMTFGLANVELPLAQLLYNFDWKLPNGIEPQDLNMIENPGITSSRKENLYVIATPYELT
ncbi:Cytochrome [Abeliophyllum distichum]|uniref:Cytochrome n=1 Tax=Abeliophyllum distichum TaxID=126358 RepID=A0ABD1Q8C1_9LAMI